MTLYTGGSQGSIWYWVTFGFMAVTAVGVALVTFLGTPMLHRAHGYLTLGILCTAATAYYTMAINEGSTPVGIDNSPGDARTMYWARYVDWFITTPLLLLDVLLFTDLPLGHTIWILASDVAMILLGLFGALTVSSQGFKWGFFAISCCFQLVITNGLFAGYKTTHLRAPKIRTVYMGLAAYLSVLWLGYPIVWGLAEGSNTISVTSEIGAYAILDILTKCVFGVFIMLSVPYLTKSFEQEHADGVYDSDILGAPIYSPFSKTRHYEEHHLLRGNKRHPKATTGTNQEPIVGNSNTPAV